MTSRLVAACRFGPQLANEANLSPRLTTLNSRPMSMPSSVRSNFGLVARLIQTFFILLLVARAPGVLRADTALIPAGAIWKYLDNGSNQATAWRGTSFSDAAWVSGSAELGYGDGDEATVV